MSGKVKVKAVKHKDKDVAEIFNQMLGAGDHVNMNICYPKYIDMREYCTKLLKAFGLFCDAPCFKKYGEFEGDIAKIREYIEAARKKTTEIFSMDFSDYEWNLELLEPEQKKQFSEMYEKAKSCEIVNTFIIVCDNLINYRSYIADIDKLDHKFILNMPGVEFAPFPFTNMNLKRLFTLMSADAQNDPGESSATNAKNAETYGRLMHYMMLLLNKIFTLSHGLYKVISKPDIDVDEFVEVIMNNLSEVKKHIPRCEKAFKKIEESVHLLRDNFSTYYKDFVSTKNQTIIMENFILDVSKNTKADPTTTRQFREIINYYRKLAKNNIKNPQLKMLFDKVDENVAKLEKYNNINRAEREDAESSDESDYDEEIEIERDEYKEEREKNMEKSVDELAEEINK